MNSEISRDQLTRIQNRAVTCFLGQMTGDALGARYEFSERHFGLHAREQIRRDRHGKRHLPILGGGIFGVDPGQVTDDTEMALSLLDSILEHKGASAEGILQGYLRWTATKPFDIGRNTSFIFNNQKNRTVGDSKYLAEIFNIQTRERYQNDNLSNGSLMRIAPLGILLAPMMWYSLRESPLLTASNLLNTAAADTLLSHASHTAVIASGVYLALVAGNVGMGRPGLEITLKVAQTVARQDPITEQIFNSAKAGQPLTPPATVNPGYLGHALSLAIRMSVEVGYGHKTFYQAMVETVELGGDTDTNCAIVGAAIGGLVDLRDIPQQWVEAVLNSGNKPFMCRRKRQHPPYGRFKLAKIQRLVNIGLDRYTFRVSKRVAVYGPYSYDTIYEP